MEKFNLPLCHDVSGEEILAALNHGLQLPGRPEKVHLPLDLLVELLLLLDGFLQGSVLVGSLRLQLLLGIPLLQELSTTGLLAALDFGLELLQTFLKDIPLPEVRVGLSLKAEGLLSETQDLHVTAAFTVRTVELLWLQPSLDLLLAEGICTTLTDLLALQLSLCLLQLSAKLSERRLVAAADISAIRQRLCFSAALLLGSER